MGVTGQAVLTVGASVAQSNNGVNYTGSPKENYKIVFGTTEVGYYLHRQGATATTGGTTYNLAAFTDVFGNAASMSQIKAIIALNNQTTGGNLLVGGGSNPVYANAYPAIYPGGVLCQVYPATSGQPVTSGAAMNLKILASSGTVSYDLLVIGS